MPVRVRTMKTPWRSSPVVPSLSVLLSKDVKWSHDATLWCHTWQSEPAQVNLSENPKNRVFQPSDLDLWPLTLTFKLIRDIVKVNPSIKFWVRTFNGSARRALTDTHTQTGPIPYPRPLTQLREWWVNVRSISALMNSANPPKSWWLHSQKGFTTSQPRVISHIPG